MSTYQPNIPTGLVALDTDYANLQKNFQQLDTSFAVDHYTFSDNSSNNGRHNQVTLPLIVGGSHPSTPSSRTRIYGMQDCAGIGLIDYSRGPSSAIPTPLNNLNSTTTAITLTNDSTSDIVDLTGLKRCYMYISILNESNNPTRQYVNEGNVYYWNDGTPHFITPLDTGINFVTTGNILKIKNLSGVTLSNIYWNLQLLRIET